MNRLDIESKPAYVRINGEVSHAYNEAAFRYFLTLERRRAERHVRPLLLVLVKLRKHSQSGSALTPPTLATIFSALSACVREVDFVGWYREGVVAAAALIPSSNTAEQVQHHVNERVVRVLRMRLSASDVARLAVRVIELGPKARM